MLAITVPMSNRPLKSFFSSGFQAISVQIFGGAFFYILSVTLSKHDFGILNWSTAISLFITTILGFGMDQVVVRRMALSKSSDWAAAAFFLHSLVGVVVSFGMMMAILALYGSERRTLVMLPSIFIVQSLVFVAMPFRQFLNAKERFAPYGIISLVSNVLKIVFILYLAPQYKVTLNAVIWLLTATGAAELLFLLVYVKAKFKLSFSFKFTAYKKLVRESSAQYLSVLFDSSLSRMDWILLGLISAQMALADYSFAFRAYEMMKLPIVVIGAVILPRFARMFASGVNVTYDKRHEIRQFLKMEIVLAGFIILVANILWTPVVDAFSSGKYGASNWRVFMILSLCLPLHFLINLFWTLIFSAKKYRYITIATIATAVLNIAFNLVFIPLLGAEGAAIAFALATLVQLLIYAYLTRRKVMSCDLNPLLVTVSILVAAFAAAYFATGNVYLRLVIALGIYLPLVFATKQMGREQISILKSYLRR